MTAVDLHPLPQLRHFFENIFTNNHLEHQLILSALDYIRENTWIVRGSEVVAD